MKFLKNLNPIVVGIVALVIGVVVGTQIPSCKQQITPWGYSGPIRVEWKSAGKNGGLQSNAVNITQEGINNLYIKNGKIYRLGHSKPAFSDAIDNKYNITLG